MNAEAVSGYTVIMFACFGTVDVVNALIDAGKSSHKYETFQNLLIRVTCYNFWRISVTRTIHRFDLLSSVLFCCVLKMHRQSERYFYLSTSRIILCVCDLTGADVNKSGEPDSDAVYIAAALNKLDIVDALVAAGMFYDKNE